MTANDIISKVLIAGSGTRRLPAFAVFLASLSVILWSLARPALAAAPVKGEVSVQVSGGFARLIFRFAEEIESDVRTANGIVVVAFKRPVDIAVDRMSSAAPDYIGAARRDPDGMGIRVALSRKAAVNFMAAGERLFVDLLPDTWTGVKPGLPQEVVEELAKRARDAEKKARQQLQMVAQRKQPPLRVRVGKQPTFTRYVFDLPDKVGVSNERAKDQLTLVFDAPLKFDLADAQAAPPAAIAAIDAEMDLESVSVRFAFAGKVDVRTFREDTSYVVDVVPTGAKKPRDGLEASESEEPAADESAAGNNELPPGVEPPATVPAAAAKPAPEAPAKLPAPPPAKVVEAPPAPVMPAVVDLVSAPTQAPVAVGPPSEKPAVKPPAKAAAEPAGEAAPAPRAPPGTVVVELARQGDGLRLAFPFTAPTAAAVFRRADTLWLVFDANVDIDLAALNSEPSRTIRSASVVRSREETMVRIKLERPRLTGMAAEGPTWTVSIGDAILEPTKPLVVTRSIVGPTRASVIIPFEDPRQLHRIVDPEIGDTLLIVTAHGPARGFVKTQDFVEFRALASTHGVVIQPLADDLNAELAVDKIVIGRPLGLTLSAASFGSSRTGTLGPVVLDAQLWGFDRQADFTERQSLLVRTAAAAPESKRATARRDLARFYLAREMNAEAKAVLDVALTAERPTAEDVPTLVLRAIANIMLNRTDEALRDLANPLVGNQHDAPLWRALAQARQGKWAEAREGFKNVEVAMGTLPIELQRLELKEAVRASIEVRDFAGAANLLDEFETIGVPRELEPAISVLTGRLAEGLGRAADALVAYRAAAESWDRSAAAQGRLREVVLRSALGDLKRPDVISELESLTTLWRGDETEIEALQLLARSYTEEERFRDAFYVMRTALTAHPNSEMTRRIQDEAASTFDALFLAGKGDALPTIDALSLFYDFRELTPIGRRGDEMIRRLADRLVTVDLLDQAAELLQYQVDHRLQGGARAQVATRLAVIYLMNRKPDRALATLRATRTADLSNELRNQRLLIEARALSDVGRYDVALEVIANIQGREAVRLRSDILWAGRRWSEAAEQIEVLYGARWQDFEPLTDIERRDILRAAIGFALGEDTIGVGRFREKYAAKMAEGPDRRSFEVVTAPTGTSGAEFRDVATSVAAVDTLDGFLRDMRARFPDIGGVVLNPAAAKAATVPPATAPKASPATTGTTPKPPARQAAAR
jgi:tetratricopeptide (TPR) repeat protein